MHYEGDCLLLPPTPPAPAPSTCLPGKTHDKHVRNYFTSLNSLNPLNSSVAIPKVLLLLLLIRFLLLNLTNIAGNQVMTFNSCSPPPRRCPAPTPASQGLTPDPMVSTVLCVTLALPPSPR